MDNDTLHYDETAAQMADPARYEQLRRLTVNERHPCPVPDCRLSAEEHHRLSFGVLGELKELRRRVREYEANAGTTKNAQ